MPVKVQEMEVDETSPKKEIKLENALIRKSWRIETEDPTNFDDFFLNCRMSINKNVTENNHIQAFRNTLQKLQDARRRVKQLSLAIKNFVETKEFIFTTPIDELKTHPQIQAFSPENFSAKSEGQAAGEGLEVLSVVASASADLPPIGELKREELKPGMKVWAMKTSTIDIFLAGTVMSVRESKPENLYKVRLDYGTSNIPKLYSAKQLAYRKTPSIIVPVGTRIVARYEDGIYAGIIAEPPKSTNGQRYLIFFDDGYAQYMQHKDIYIVCAQSIDVADDVHQQITEFIKIYLQRYPERPMLKLNINQMTKTEYERKWWDTKVLDIDASMAKIYFTRSGRTEWIYRGSTRLHHLYVELMNAERRKNEKSNNRRHNIVPRKPHQPYVEYTREQDHIVTIDSGSDEETSTPTSGIQRAKRKTGGSQYLNNSVKSKNTARKSNAMRPRSSETTEDCPQLPQDLISHQGFKDIHNLVKFTRNKYEMHYCSPKCREKSNPSEYRGRNPFMVPMYMGWERQIRKFKKTGGKTLVIHRTPCGRHLRDIQEIQEYLILIDSRLTIDLFSVNTNLMAFRNFRPKGILCTIDDVTQGRENLPISCVNAFGNEPPPFFEYAAKSYPGKGVPLNQDKEFLCGCSCTDNCQDPGLCECQQISNYACYGKLEGDAAYKHRRLKNPIVTGIYECNSRCSCNSQCGNRVVQHGLRIRLQMFKTQNKGWGIRCLDDIDVGMFICIYAGQLLTEQGADEDGNLFGDEYLAELDHIEVAEQFKEGYESEVVDLENLNLNDLSPKVKDADADNEMDFSDSGSDANLCDSDIDIDFEFRQATDSTSNTTSSRKSKRMKRSDSSSSISTSSLSTYDDVNPSKDKSCRGDSFMNPLSPNSAKYVEETELQREPKLSSDYANSEAKVMAKKSLAVKHPVAPSPILSSQRRTKFKSVRSYFGETALYLMDAKSKGNIGKYLNHSCAPNVFVQNVFLESHDLRFPEVAFFANQYITAGRELTWDYNYEVGSVPEKVLYCYCESRCCRGRLL